MLEVGTMLGRYRLVEELARGAMGKVYKGHDPALDRAVALKVMSTALATSPEEEEEFRARFEREARIAASLHHPNIVQVHDVGADPAQGLLFIAMEYIDGETLRDILEREGKLPPARVAAIGAAVSDALHFAHTKGIVHRDVKPSNILLGSGGDVKLTDFGIARVPLSDLTRTGVHVGTPNFMSPEQVKGRTADARSDLFSLGVAIYWMLTGKRPFGDDDPARVAYRTVNVLPVPPHETDPSIDVALSRVVLKVLEKDPGKRYQTAEELVHDLRPFSSTLSSAAVPAAPVRSDGGAGAPSVEPARAAGPATPPAFPAPTRAAQPAAPAAPPAAPGPTDTVAIPRSAVPAIPVKAPVVGLPLLIGGVAAVAFLLGTLATMALLADRQEGTNVRSAPPPPTTTGTSADAEVERAWDLGVDYYRAGKLPEAQAQFEAILARRPDHADAARYLALLQEAAPGDTPATGETPAVDPEVPVPPDAVSLETAPTPGEAATPATPGREAVIASSAPGPELPAMPSPRPTPPPDAALRIELSHRLEQGTLEVRIDGKSAGQFSFEGKDRPFVGVRGELETTVRVPSGSHMVTFVVVGRRKDQAVRQERTVGTLQLPAAGSVRVQVELDRAGNLEAKVAEP